jgi:hypothetical protein
MSADPFKDVRERRALATEGDWAADGEGNVLISAASQETYFCDYKFETTHDTAAARYDSEFIAHAPADIDRLLVDNERLREALDAAMQYVPDKDRAWVYALAAPSVGSLGLCPSGVDRRRGNEGC